MNLPLLWFAFFVCTLAILYSGTRLSKYGDIIAEKTGLGGVWIGVILLAFVTSLPELVTGLSSVLIFQTPDIAAGDIFGSCVFNILILSLLDVFDRASPISSRVQQRHVLSAGFGILMLAIVAVNLFISGSLTNIFSVLGWIGLSTPIIILIYVLSMRMIFYHERKAIAAFVKEKVEELKYEETSIRKVYINFSLNSLILFLSSLFLP
jgi:cation:H+ antiporter